MGERIFSFLDLEMAGPVLRPCDHVFDERYSRGTAGLAGASVDPYRIWLEDWEITRVKDSKATDERFPVRIKAEMSDGTALDVGHQASLHKSVSV